MRVVVSVQSQKASSRGLVHYVAHSKIDSERESKVREIFNPYADQVSVEKANDFLKSGVSQKRPANAEIHHLVISLKAEDYDLLGADEKEKQASLKKITRHAMKQLEESIGADKLNWAAGIHRNTDHPHVHVAVRKEYFDKNFEKRTLQKIPTGALPHYEKNGEGDKTFTPGILIEAASAKLDEIILEKTKNKNRAAQNIKEQNSPYHSADKSRREAENLSENTALPETKSNSEIEHERDVLARALLAKFHLEKSQENLESLETGGQLRRFRITDRVTNQKRRMSLFDLERRAEKSAMRQIKKQNVTDAVKRDELKRKLIGSEIEKNSDAVKRIRAILHNLIVKENQNLRRREEDYERIKPVAEKIRGGYRGENKKLPAPNLSRDELEMLQTRSLEKRDLRAAVYYERVRAELASERGVPTRTDEDIRRLKAVRSLTELKVIFREQQLRDLSSGKRALPVEIGGEKWSLARTERLIEKRASENRKFTGNISKVLDKFGLVEKKVTRAKLEEIKLVIAEKLSEKAENLSGDLQREKSILKTLEEFYKNDTHPEKETLGAKFSATELEEIESLAFELKLAHIYRENFEQQKQYMMRGGGESGEPKIPAESLVELKQKIIVGRAIAREIMCETQLSSAKEERALFNKNKNFQKFEVVNEKNGESKFVCLKEVEFDSRGSILDQTLEYFTENRDKRSTRHQLEKIVKEKESELKENQKSGLMLLKVAREETVDYKQKSFFGATKYLDAPLFTPKELITLELRIKQTENKSEATKLQKILDSADFSKAKSLSAILASFATEKDFSGTADQQSTKEQHTVQSVAELEEKAQNNQTEIHENKLSGGRETTRENKAENRNQERGR